MSQVKDNVKNKQDQKYKKPRKWNIIMYNDDFTPFEFVEMLLTDIFRKTSDQSRKITMDIHKKGKGIAYTSTLEIVETKMKQAAEIILKSNYPLLLSREPVE